MKNFYILFTALLLATAALSAPKIRLTTINGLWQNPASWDLNRIPTGGDTIIIPTGMIVQITEPSTITGIVFMKVYGTVYLNTGKMDVGSGSTMCVYTNGLLTSNGSNSEKFRIGNVEKYRGTDPVITGPKFADNTTGDGFLPMVGGMILPVRFIAFNVSAKNNTALIQWTTTDEFNASHFEIQKSSDGSNWTPIASVGALNKGKSINEYAFTDHSFTGRKTYFRIQQVDFDGKIAYTAIRTLSNKEYGGIKMNASANTTVIHFGKLTENVTIAIHGMNGQLITRQQHASAIGQVQVKNPASLKGIYIVSVYEGSERTAVQQMFNAN